MITLNQIINTLTDYKDTLQKDYNVSRIGVFGSYVTGQQKDNSDIDFLVEFDSATIDIFEAKYALRSFLKNLFDKDIDLTRSLYLKPYIKAEILNSTKYAI